MYSPYSRYISGGNHARAYLHSRFVIIMRSSRFAERESKAAERKVHMETTNKEISPLPNDVSESVEASSIRDCIDDRGDFNAACTRSYAPRIVGSAHLSARDFHEKRKRERKRWRKKKSERERERKSRTRDSRGGVHLSKFRGFSGTKREERAVMQSGKPRDARFGAADVRATVRRTPIARGRLSSRYPGKRSAPILRLMSALSERKQTFYRPACARRRYRAISQCHLELLRR